MKVFSISAAATAGLTVAGCAGVISGLTASVVAVGTSFVVSEIYFTSHYSDSNFWGMCAGFVGGVVLASNILATDLNNVPAPSVESKTTTYILDKPCRNVRRQGTKLTLHGCQIQSVTP